MRVNKLISEYVLEKLQLYLLDHMPYQVPHIGRPLLTYFNNLCMIRRRMIFIVWDGFVRYQGQAGYF